MAGSVSDIHPRKQAEAIARAMTERFELAAAGAVDAIWDLDVATGALYYSERWLDLLGYAPSELPSHMDGWRERLDPDDQQRIWNAFDAHFEHRVPFDLEYRLLHKDGEHRRLRISGQARWDARGIPVRMAGSLTDISARKAAEAEAQRLYERFELVARGVADGIWDLDTRTGRCYLSARYNALMGRAAIESFDNDNVDKWLELLHPDDKARALDALDRHLIDRVPYDVEYRLRRDSGDYRWFRSCGRAVWDAGGRALRMAGSISDIHERKRAELALQESEARLRVALADKETLLKEVYHRVKNNLQVIRSLLNLESHALEDGQGRTAMLETAERVRAMALVHEKLYQSGDLSAIDLADYVRDLLAQLDDSTNARQRGIRMVAEVDTLEAGLDIAIPLGLLLTELVTNSLKHAFPEGRRGMVRVQLRGTGDGGAGLIAADDGVGLTGGLEIEASPSLGLRLARALAMQLGGTLGARNDGGATFALEIPALR